MGEVLTSLQFMYLLICPPLKNNVINSLGAMEGALIIPFYPNAYNYSRLLFIEPHYDWPISEVLNLAHHMLA